MDLDLDPDSDRFNKNVERLRLEWIFDIKFTGVFILVFNILPVIQCFSKCGLWTNSGPLVDP